MQSSRATTWLSPSTICAASSQAGPPTRSGARRRREGPEGLIRSSGDADMTPSLPKLEQFRIELRDNGLVHLVFDAPGRTMNVFSDAALVEGGLFAHWLAEADVRGALIRSGKESGVCAGANLPEIWAAYDMVTSTPKYRRFGAAYDHFFRLSRALRALETSGKPVAAAVAGLALGGGGELALASHYRVLTDDKHAAIGLPESLG